MLLLYRHREAQRSPQRRVKNMKNLTLKAVREQAAKANKTVIYNRSTGLYQVTHGFTASEGVMPARDEKGRLCLDQNDLAKLASYI